MWPLGAMGKSPANAHRNFRPCHRFRRAGINTFQWRSIADSRLTFTSHFRLGFEPIVKIAPIFSVAEFVKLVGTLLNFLFSCSTDSASCRSSTRCGYRFFTFLLPYERLVLTFACKLVEDELLRQTSNNMQAHSDSKVLEYVLSIAVRTWVVREGNRRRNQTATPRRVIRLCSSVVSLADKRS